MPAGKADKAVGKHVSSGVGADGAVFALRRELYSPLEAGTSTTSSSPFKSYPRLESRPGPRGLLL
jgi:hypothetical protein